jgi:uncharacterized membrane protein
MLIGVSLHVLSAALLLGALFFAHALFRPTTEGLEPPARLRLWRRALGQFLVWGWIGIAVLLGSGFALIWIGFGGFAAPLHVRAMMALGVLSAASYTYLYFVPWRRFRRAVLQLDWGLAEKNVRQIRVLMGAMLIVVSITAAIGAGGRYLG